MWPNIITIITIITAESSSSAGTTTITTAITEFIGGITTITTVTIWRSRATTRNRLRASWRAEVFQLPPARALALAARKM